MKNTYLEIQGNQKLASYTVTEAVHQEKKHLIVPVVMIVEGVLNGSHGPLLHLAEDFGKIPESWNGIPVVINHPEEEGHSISANSPEVIERQSVGVIYNARMDSNRLLAECWLGSEKLGKVSSDTLIAVNEGKTIEVSVGVYTEDESIAGEWNGIKYNAIARNHRPDHLALLPGGIGACSVENGCGIRVNQNKKGGKRVDKKEAIDLLKGLGQKIYEVGVNMAVGMKEKLDLLYSLVRSLNSPDTWHYLTEAYDTYLIYSIETGGIEKTYKRNYQMNLLNGVPEFVGDPIEVVRKVEYDEIEVNTNINFKRTKGKGMSKEGCVPCIEKKVNELIANTATPFTEVDRGWLEKFSETDLNAMYPTVVPPVVNKLSDDDLAALTFGKAELAKKKAAMIAEIQANCAAGVWDMAELTTMSESFLEKISKSTRKEQSSSVDYSLSGNANFTVNTNRGGVQPLLPNV